MIPTWHIPEIIVIYNYPLQSHEIVTLPHVTRSFPPWKGWVRDYQREELNYPDLNSPPWKSQGNIPWPLLKG